MKMTYNFPGYVLIEGLDLTGKTTTSKKLVDLINSKSKVSVEYKNGFFRDVDHKKLLEIENSHEPVIKERIFKDIYLSDIFGPDNHYNKIQIQDRYYPSIVFYGYVKNNTPIDLLNLHKNFLLPRCVILLESDFQSKIKRSKDRDRFHFLERVILEDEHKHDVLAKMYRRIIELTGVPFSIVDTSDLPPEEVALKCFDTLNSIGALTDQINLDALLATNRYEIHKSTVELYLKNLDSGLKIEPPLVNRIYQDEDASKATFVIEDGRHKSLATYKYGMKKIPAYLNHIKMRSSDFKENLVPLLSLNF